VSRTHRPQAAALASRPAVRRGPPTLRSRTDPNRPDPTQRSPPFLVCNILASRHVDSRAAVAWRRPRARFTAPGPIPNRRAGLARPVVAPMVRDLLRRRACRGAIDCSPSAWGGLVHRPAHRLTAAKVLAYATQRPLVGFDSLEAIARNAPESARLVAVVATRSGATLRRRLRPRLRRARPAARPSHADPHRALADGRPTWPPALSCFGPGLESSSARLRLRDALPGHVEALPGDTRALARRSSAALWAREALAERTPR